ncbi:MAG: PhnD/SsuA/transferrin family substrate-binding protein, partial [Shewanella sp.]
MHLKLLATPRSGSGLGRPQYRLPWARLLILWVLLVLAAPLLSAVELTLAEAPPIISSLDSADNGFVGEQEVGYQVIDVGVLAIRGYKAAINRWQPQMAWLEKQIPNTYFRLHPLSLDKLTAGVADQNLDFVITNPGQSVLLARQYSLTWLATLRSSLTNDAAMQVGSALVVRADSPYQTLMDLKG